MLAETRKGGTPWHAHHITERYGLLTIIALGEGVVGTVASLSAVVGAQGWSVDAVFARSGGHRADVRHVVDVLRGAGRRICCTPIASGPSCSAISTSRSFGGDRRDRRRSACGRLLRRAPFGARLGRHGLAVAVPVAVYIVLVFVLYALMVRTLDGFHVLLVVGTARRAGVGGRGWPHARGSDGHLPAVATLAPDGHRRGLRNAGPPARRRCRRPQPSGSSWLNSHSPAAVTSALSTYSQISGYRSNC